MTLGAADDVVRAPDLVSAKAQMTMLRPQRACPCASPRSGGRGSRHPPPESSRWRCGSSKERRSSPRSASRLRSPGRFAHDAAHGCRPGRLRELHGRARPGALSFDDVIVGNEPNRNRFWPLQYGPGGENVAALKVLLLAQSYDAVKGTDPAVRVWARSLPRRRQAEHGPRYALADQIHHRPRSGLPRSGRQQRIMDGLAIHPYGENSSTPPTFVHPELQLDRNRGLPEARRTRRTGFRRHRTTWIDA